MYKTTPENQFPSVPLPIQRRKRNDLTKERDEIIIEPAPNQTLTLFYSKKNT